MELMDSQTQSAAEPTCPRADRWWGACDWRPRYDSRPILPPDFTVETLLGIFDTEKLEIISDLLAGLKETKYVHEVCVTCGKIAKRSGED